MRQIPRSAFREGIDTPYTTVLFEGIRANHLQLPIELHKRVTEEWKQRGEGGGLEIGQVNRKLHAVWLVGQILLRALNAKSYPDLDANQVAPMVEHMDDCFGDVYPVVSKSIDDTVASLTWQRDDGTPSVSLRQALRSSRHYDAFIRELTFRLEREGGEYLSNSRDKLIPT